MRFLLITFLAGILYGPVSGDSCDVDLCISIDQTNVEANWDMTIDWLIDIVSELDIGSAGVRTGVKAATEDGSTQVEWTLKDSGINTDVSSAVAALDGLRGSTRYNFKNFQGATRAPFSCFKKKYGGRQNNDKDVALVITDGLGSGKLHKVEKEGNSLQGKVDMVIAVGIEGYNLEFLELVGSPGQVYTADTFADLDSIKMDVLNAICNQPTLPPVVAVTTPPPVVVVTTPPPTIPAQEDPDDSPPNVPSGRVKTICPIEPKWMINVPGRS